MTQIEKDAVPENVKLRAEVKRLKMQLDNFRSNGDHSECEDRWYIEHARAEKAEAERDAARRERDEAKANGAALTEAIKGLNRDKQRCEMGECKSGLALKRLESDECVRVVLRTFYQSEGHGADAFRRAIQAAVEKAQT